MTALAADIDSRPRKGTPKEQRFPVAVDIIYKNSLVMINAAGYLAPAADTVGCRVVGVASEQVDNSGGSAGDLFCLVHYDAKWLFSSTSTLTQAHVALVNVVVADDNNVGLAADETNDIPAGCVSDFVSSSQAWVHIPGISALV